MKRYNWFLAGILLASIAFMAMGQTYITNVSDWLIEDSTLVRCNISGSVNILGTTYYCDNNHGSDAENGLSWKTATKTLAKAMELSHAKIASGGHATDRNIIYYTADAETDDLTKLAQKTDIIGVGHDAGAPRPTLKGNHDIEAATEASYMGCRFFNVNFEPQTADACMDIPANQHQIVFDGCYFQAHAKSICGITAISSNGLMVRNCHFIRDVGNNKGFLTAAINIGNGTIVHVDISDNWIDAEIGIVVYDITATLGCSIHDNFIHATTLTIDENSDTFWIYGNRMISDAACDGTEEDSAHDFASAMSVDNMLTGNGVCQWLPDPNDADL